MTTTNCRNATPPYGSVKHSFIATFIVVPLFVATALCATLSPAYAIEPTDASSTSDAGTVSGNSVAGTSKRSFVLLPVISRLSFSSYGSNLVHSSTTTVEPGIIFKRGTLTALTFLELSYSHNTLNTAEVPALSGLVVADTTSYDSVTIVSIPRYTFLGIFSGVSFDDKVSTETVLDTGIVGFTRDFPLGKSVEMSLGLGVIYLRSRDAVFPIPLVKADITKGNLFASIGYPQSYFDYRVIPDTYSVSGELDLLGRRLSSSLTNTYTPTKRVLVDFSYHYNRGLQTYGFLQNNTFFERVSHHVSSKLEYSYFYVKPAYYFSSKIKHITPATRVDNVTVKTTSKYYKEKPYAAISFGIEYRE